MAGGRPTKYNSKLTGKILERLACGESLRSICRDDDMPNMSTIFLWIRKHEEFSNQYAKAKEEGATALFEEIFDIADDSGNDWMENNNPDNPGWRFNNDHYQRARLRVDVRKWALSKLQPKKYGEKLDLTSDGEKVQGVTVLPAKKNE